MNKSVNSLGSKEDQGENKVSGGIRNARVQSRC